jgi:hypothetical protein
MGGQKKGIRFCLGRRCFESVYISTLLKYINSFIRWSRRKQPPISKPSSLKVNHHSNPVQKLEAKNLQ